MRVPTAFTLITIIIFVVTALTWILPAGQFDRTYNEAADREVVMPGTYKVVEPSPQGIMDALSAFSKGIQDSVDVIAFVLIVGGAYGVILKTGAIESGINALIKRLGNKDKILIPVIMTLFAIGGTTTGMAEETLPFYAMMMPVMIMLGYDAIVAMAIVFVGAAVGTMASTINPFSTGIASGIAATSIGDDLYLRAIFWVIAVTVAIIYVYVYASMVKKNPKRSLVYHLRDSHLKAFSKSSGAANPGIFTKRDMSIIVIFFSMIIFMIYAIVKLEWWLTEISMLFFGASIIIGFIGSLKDRDFWDSFIAGSKDLLPAALVIGLARGIVMVATDGNIIDTMLFYSSGALSGLSNTAFIISNQFLQMVIAFFVPSSSGHAALTMPIMAPLGDIFGISRDSLVTSYQFASGLTNMITPTSGVVMAAISIVKIDWFDWVKFILPLMVMLFILSIPILLISI